MRVRRTAGAAGQALAPHIEAILERSDTPLRASEDAVREALDSDAEADPEHVVDPRGDATDIPFVTVDPVGARDLDQALHLERVRAGFRLRYAIADVAAHVVPGGALDALAHARGATVYCPDRRIGLHPPEMSEAHASLLPGQRTKAVLWTVDIDRDGEIGQVSLERTWVRSRRQLAYRDLGTSASAEDAELRDILGEVGSARRAAVRRQGGVTLPLPEQEVTSHDGRLHLELRAGSRAEDDNAHLSLATGMAGARLMMAGGTGVLRTMPAASEEALATLRRQARALGVAWSDHASYGEVLSELDPQEASSLAFLTAATRLFRGARWEAFDRDAGQPLPDPPIHGALGAPYAHVTAPLRRLVDRYATEAALARSLSRPVSAWARDGLERAAQDTAAGTSRANDVERRCIDALESLVLSSRVGETFEGVALDDRTVQLTQPPVVARCDGEVPPGETVRVRVTRAAPPDGPEFALAGQARDTSRP